MSYDRMKKREAELEAEDDRWLKAAEAACGGGQALRRPARRRDAGLGGRQAEAAWEDPRGQGRAGGRSQATAEAESKARAAAEARRVAEGGKESGKTPTKTEPDGKAQRNFTDPESRILKTKDGYIQGYNAQAAVDGAHQIIVAQTLTSSSSDQAQPAPLLDGIRANLGTNPDEVSADAGYCSAANLRTIKRRRIEGYIATGRQKHGTKSATAKKASRAGSLMSTKLQRAGCRSRYRLRKQIVEPVFGQIKQARGFRQFLLRGIDKVKAEWAPLGTAHNLVKLARAAWAAIIRIKPPSRC
jgi:hypothetical protein